ncbi:MAG: ubiquitin-like domain-containing protein [Clostridia bacterium]|nr:ubiquitin-like domain-containing protein [Clostridia bacterium]
MKKVLTLATVLLLVLTLFAGCGKEAQEITIKDQKNSVTVTFEKGMTVKDLLAQVGVVLAEKDEVTPALDTVLEEPVEVSVARYAKVNVVITEEVKEEATEAATEEAEEATSEEATTEAAAPATKTVEVELVGGTVADALEKAGIKADEVVEINVELTDYLSDLEGDILVTVGELKVEEESATAEGVTEPVSEAATEEATTAKTTTTTTTSSYDDEDDTTTTTRRPITDLTTNRTEVTEPETAPTMEPIITEAPSEAPSEGNGGNDEPETERTLVKTEWAPGCDDPNSGYVVYWYSDGTYETVEYAERPDWI